MEELDLDQLLNEVSSVENKEEIKGSLIEEPEKVLEELDVIPKYKKEEIKKEATKVENSDDFLREYIEEIQEDVKRYLREKYRINQEIKALKEELKEIKDELKDSGVKIAPIERAYKEMVNELKESAEDAKIIESVKNIIKDDVELYGMVREEAQ